MTLRVWHLITALLLLSLSGNHVVVKAADSTDDEQATIDESYESIEYDVATSCGADVCSTECQDVLLEAYALPDCTSSSGTNFYEYLATSYACIETATSTSASTDDSCSDDVETQTFDMITSYEPDACVDDPCETSCYNLLAELSSSLVSSTSSDSYNYADYYSSWIANCSTSEEGATTSSAASASSATGSSESAEAPATESNGTSEATSSPESATSSEATDEEEAAEASTPGASASGSVSASKDNGAASVGSSALSSLVVAGTLALLAIQV